MNNKLVKAISNYNPNMLKLKITLSFTLKGLSFFVNLKVGLACFLTFVGLLRAHKPHHH